MTNLLKPASIAEASTLKGIKFRENPKNKKGLKLLQEIVMTLPFASKRLSEAEQAEVNELLANARKAPYLGLETYTENLLAELALWSERLESLADPV